MKIDKNFVIFITGGASGLGKAAAKHFLKQGCRVSVADVKREGLQEEA